MCITNYDRIRYFAGRRIDEIRSGVKRKFKLIVSYLSSIIN